MTKRQKIMLFRIAATVVLLATAVNMPIEGWLRFSFFLLPYLLIGWDVLWSAARNILNGQVFDENFLMAIATVGAFATKEFPEGVAVMLFYQIGDLFEGYAVGKSRKSIASLMDIRPDYANIERDGTLVQVDPEEVAIDEIIVVKPGEKVPLDGVVVEGTTFVDTAALTGESVPREIFFGDEVISGCINQNGLIRVRVTKHFGESTVSKILDLVENSSSKKAKAESFITKFARYYTPAVVFAAIALAIIPPLVFGGDWKDWIHRALIFLVISCPCALVISVPLSFFGGIGGASKCGILVKGGNYMEALAAVDTVVFDKTGTLTKGVFNVSSVHPQGMDEKELLALAAYAENYSDHPISRSLKKAWGADIDAGRISDVEELSGRGVRARVDGKLVSAGNGKLMNEQSIEYDNNDEAGTVVHVALEDKYAGYIVISDEMKPDALEAIRKLKANGVKKTVMLTGDAKKVADIVAAELGVDEVHSELLPADKVSKVEELLSVKPGKSTLAFAGDGINDAPVLSRADIGIAMGALGSDAAIEAADIVLMDDKPSKIAMAIYISQKTIRIVKQNIVFALGVKGITLVLGAMGIASMWWAVFADVGVSVIAILNAMRALNIEKQKV